MLVRGMFPVDPPVPEGSSDAAAALAVIEHAAPWRAGLLGRRAYPPGSSAPNHQPAAGPAAR